jgi:phosphatidylserine/phosphatidylglycerophosphate/cardiolipin synthase-like enzyme
MDIFFFHFVRESEPNSWEDTMKDELDREKYPRMPWHDVHCALWGPPCRDIARHFVQRWNYAKVMLFNNWYSHMVKL